MAMLKSLVRKIGGCKQIKDYLARDGRAVTFDSSLPYLGPDDWDRVMDDTRRLWGKDVGRKYYHFVISPDPEDGLIAEQVRDLAVEWARERYAGKEWVVETHDDNGIPHAHVVVNSVDPNDGYKIQISDDDVRKDAMSLQVICKEHGCSAFDDFELSQEEDGMWVAKSPLPYARRQVMLQRAKEQNRRRTQAQRWAATNGVHLWTDDMHEDIEAALSGCRTWRSFEAALSKAGYRMSVSRRGVLTFHPPEGRGHPVKGYKLDDSYTVEGLRARLAPRLDGAGARTSYDPDLIPEPIRLPRSFEDIVHAHSSRTRRQLASESRLRAAIDALAIIRSRGYVSFAEMRAESERLSAQASELESRLGDIENALAQSRAAEARLRRIAACRERLTPEPADEAWRGQWREFFADELYEIDELAKWLRERGIDPDTTTSDDVRASQDEFARQARELSERARGLGADASRLASATTALSSLPLPVGPTDIRARNERERARRRRRGQAGAVSLSRDQARDLMRLYEQKMSDQARAIDAGLLTASGLIEIERKYEERRDEILAQAQKLRSGGNATWGREARPETGRPDVEAQEQTTYDYKPTGRKRS